MIIVVHKFNCLQLSGWYCSGKGWISAIVYRKCYGDDYANGANAANTNLPPIANDIDITLSY